MTNKYMKRIFIYLFISFFNYIVVLGYTVTFTKVLTIYLS
jgi:hypothetical protein